MLIATPLSVSTGQYLARNDPIKRAGPARRHETRGITLKGNTLKADVSIPGREVQSSKSETSASTRGLEAEAEAAEADHVVFVSLGERNAKRGRLRELQIVVEEVVVLEARLDVPAAEALRHPIQPELGGQTGREYADAVGVAEHGDA